MILFTPDTYILRVLDHPLPENFITKEDFTPSIDQGIRDYALRRVPCTLDITNENIKEVQGLTFKVTDPGLDRFDFQSKILWLSGNNLEKFALQKKLLIKGSFIVNKTRIIPEFIKDYNPEHLRNSLPLFDFELPEYGKRTILKSNFYNRFSYNDIIFSAYLTNIPYDYYKESLWLNTNFFLYDFVNNCYSCNIPEDDKGRNFFKNVLFDIANNGLQKALLFTLENNGNLANLESYNRLIIAKLLRLPSIPAFILSTNYKNEDIVGIPDKNLKAIASKILSPYIIL